jgi:hypothetical protein
MGMSNPRPLSPEFLETLLNMHESDILDFKREQYPFERASKNEKGELIKDILAFANAWKTTDAHILIGVKEVAGCRACVLGVTQHIDDAKFQQLVNLKTNVPIKFAYIAVEIDEKQVGVLRIEKVQRRPVFLKEDFGKLKKGDVYLRRGSSTDVAGPEEIARMGAASFMTIDSAPSIELGFGIPSERKTFGSSIEVFPRVFVDPPRLSANEVTEAMKTMMAGLESGVLEQVRQQKTLSSTIQHSLFPKPTPKELREYYQEVALLVPVGLYVRNIGEVVAQDVRAEISLPIVDGLEVVEEQDHPRNRPSSNSFIVNNHNFMISQNLTLTRTTEKLLFEANFGKIQPQAEAWLYDLFYISSDRLLEVEMSARIFADNLPRPIDTLLKIQVSPTEMEYDPKEWEHLEEEE